jgi:hypothetical protein
MIFFYKWDIWVLYTSEDLKWNASGVLDFNSLLVSDP